MKEFTFASITYNHSNYIIEHLESIKNIIIKYGKDYKTNLLICDDASKDDTVFVINKWIEENRNLFNNIDIIAGEVNIGIVNNYLRTIRNIKTNKFKILAGDDIYLLSNIYEISKLSNLVITPIVKFSKSNVVEHKYRYLHKEALYHNDKDLKSFVANKLKYSMFIESPGAMWDLSLADNKMFQILSKYRWIEDVPLYDYLIRKQDTKIIFYDSPIIAYRADEGISNNTNHERAKQYNEDLEKICRDIFSHRKIKNKFLNPYTYKIAFQRFYIIYLKKNDKKIKDFENRIKVEEEKADKYLKEVLLLAKIWREKNIL